MNDSDNLRVLVESPGWEVICRKIEKRIDDGYQMFIRGASAQWTSLEAQKLALQIQTLNDFRTEIENDAKSWPQPAGGLEEK